MFEALKQQVEMEAESQADTLDAFKAEWEGAASRARALRPKIVHAVREGQEVAQKAFGDLAELESKLAAVPYGEIPSSEHQRIAKMRQWANELTQAQRVLEQVDKGLRRFENLKFEDVRDFNHRNQTEGDLHQWLVKSADMGVVEHIRGLIVYLENEGNGTVM